MSVKKNSIFFDFLQVLVTFSKKGNFFKNNKNKKLKNIMSQYNNLSDQLNTDQLTNLLNRRCFFSDIEQKISISKLEHPVFVMFIDLDGFKAINDEFGHTSGDELLRQYSQRLKEHPSTKKSNIYRMGGDEFMIVFENIKFTPPLSITDIMKISTEILTITDEPFIIREKSCKLSQSIGIASSKEQISAEDLLIYADTAMYEAKRLGKNRAMFYSVELHNKIKKRNEIVRLLKDAISNNEFYLVFQPKMKKSTDGYYKYGAEVLMRWENKELGFVSPQVFIPIAEETGMMATIDKWLIEESAKQIKHMLSLGIDTTYSINISAKQFSNINLPDDFNDVLNRYNINPRNIIIEITESATIKKPELAKQILRKFRSYGFGISVDDFGTGYSSIGYLRQFPVTEIKFDKSFTNNITCDEQDEIIISGLSHIAQQLHLDIVMEGVETKEQLAWIERNIPNAIIQGYFFSKPLPINEFISFSENRPFAELKV